MTVGAMVYGFGSAFASFGEPNDVDLLIIHPGIDPESCELAIACKQRLLEHIAYAHVTMLSASEATHFQFIQTAQAFCLGTVWNVHLEEDLAVVLSEIHKRSLWSSTQIAPH